MPCCVVTENSDIETKKGSYSEVESEGVNEDGEPCGY